MKGIVEIELNDVKTGRRRVHRDHNLVTKGLETYLDAIIGYNKSGNDFMPIGQKALGGIMLFKNALTESANNIVFPADNPMIACAGQDANTENSKRGSINLLESGKTASGYVNVWDFSTSQANGVISSVALTNSNVSTDPYYGVLNNSFQNIGSGTPFQRSEGYVYMAGNNGVITRKYIPSGNYSVGDQSSTVTAESEDTGRTTTGIWYNGHDGNAYRVTINDGVVTIRTLNLETYQETQSVFSLSLTNMTLYNARVCNGKVYITCRNSSDHFMLYVYNTSGTLLWSYDTGYASTVNALMGITPHPSGGCLLAVPVRVQGSYVYYYFGQTGNGEVTFDEKTYSTTSTNYAAAYITEDLLSFRVGASTDGGVVTNYLGTVFNLSEPIEKTATTTMKVRYTLTDN